MNGSREPKKRRAWLAALLSLLLPGVGQLYNRQVRLALILIILIELVAVPGLWLIAAVPVDAIVPVYGIGLLVGLGIRLFAIVQAVIGARRAKAVFLARYNRWYIYIGLWVLAVVLQTVLELMPVPSIDAYNSPSGNMIPTLMIGDHYHARTLEFASRLPERGEPAIFRPHREPDTDFVARIIGLPGDRIQLREGRLYLNATLVERVPLSEAEAALLAQHSEDLLLYREMLPGGASYLIAEVSDDERLDSTPEFVVPADHVFVLGDNRDQSNDSRGSHGFIPIEGLRDKPMFIYWSGDKSRIGRLLE